MFGELRSIGGSRFTAPIEFHSDVGPCRLSICTECGAAIVMTPGSGTVPLDLHDRWHDNIVTGLARALDEAAGRTR